MTLSLMHFSPMAFVNKDIFFKCNSISRFGVWKGGIEWSKSYSKMLSHLFSSFFCYYSQRWSLHISQMTHLTHAILLQNEDLMTCPNFSYWPNTCHTCVTRDISMTQMTLTQLSDGLSSFYLVLVWHNCWLSLCHLDSVAESI